MSSSTHRSPITPVVIAVPGAEQEAEAQLGVWAALHERDARVVLLDADPDWADEPLPHGWDPTADHESDFADRVDALLAAVDQESALGHVVHLFGIGLGSAVCIAAAARRADAVASLTVLGGWLVSDAVIQEQVAFEIELWNQSPALARRHLALLEVSPQYRKHQGPAYAPADLSSIATLDGPRLMRRLQAAHGVNVAADAADVSIPTLVIAATRDNKIAPEYSYEILGAISGAALARIRSGHGALKERLSQVYSVHAQMIRGDIEAGALVPDIRA